MKLHIEICQEKDYSYISNIQIFRRVIQNVGATYLYSFFGGDNFSNYYVINASVAKKRKMPFHDDLSPSLPPPLTVFMLNVVGKCAISDWRSDYAAQIAQIRRGYRHGIINSVLLRIGVTGTRSRDNINALLSTTVLFSCIYVSRSRRRNLIARNAFVSLAVINIKGYTRLKFIVIYGGAGEALVSPPFSDVNVSLIKCVTVMKQYNMISAV